MNERIKQLAEQAEHSVNEVFVWDAAGPDREDVIREKFAELIVRQCVEVCKSRVANSDYNTGRMHCASDIKEYFGFEE